MLQAGDVIYCDPPYDGTFTDYHTGGFADDDQYHLASILERRSSEGHSVVVSNSDTSLTRSLYRKFTCNCINAKRSMGVAAGEGKSAAEIIAVSKSSVIYSDELPWFGAGAPVGAAVKVAGGVQA